MGLDIIHQFGEIPDAKIMFDFIFEHLAENLAENRLTKVSIEKFLSYRNALYTKLSTEYIPHDLESHLLINLRYQEKKLSQIIKDTKSSKKILNEDIEEINDMIKDIAN